MDHLHGLGFGLFDPRHIGQANLRLSVNAAAAATGGAGLDKNHQADQANEEGSIRHHVTRCGNRGPGHGGMNEADLHIGQGKHGRHVRRVNIRSHIDGQVGVAVDNFAFDLKRLGLSGGSDIKCCPWMPVHQLEQICDPGLLNGRIYQS